MEDKPLAERPPDALQKDRRRGARNRRAGRAKDRRADLDREYKKLFEEYKKHRGTEMGMRVLEAAKQKTLRLHWDVLVISVKAALELENKLIHKDSANVMLEALGERSETASVSQLLELFAGARNKTLHNFSKYLIEKRLEESGVKLDSGVLALAATIFAEINFREPETDTRVEMLYKLAGLPPK